MKHVISVLSLAALALLPSAPAEARLTRERIDLHVGLPAVTAAARAPAATCGLVSVTDLFTDQQPEVGVLFGGPLAPVAPLAATVTMTCTVQTGAANAGHSGTDAVSATSPLATIGATAAVAAPVHFHAAEGQPVFVCTEVVVNGVTYYWDAAGLAWSTSSAVPCAQAIAQELYPLLLTPALDALDPVSDEIDPIVCPILEGPLIDVHRLIVGAVWDCPPSAR